MLNPHFMLNLFQQLTSGTEETAYILSKLNYITKIIFGNRNFYNVSDLGLKAYNPNKISFDIKSSSSILCSGKPFSVNIIPLHSPNQPST